MGWQIQEKSSEFRIATLCPWAYYHIYSCIEIQEVLEQMTYKCLVDSASTSP